MPVTTNPPVAAATVPTELGVPSPQLIVAVKSDAIASGLPSPKLATWPLNGLPATVVTAVAVARQRSVD